MSTHKTPGPIAPPSGEPFEIVGTKEARTALNWLTGEAEPDYDDAESEREHYERLAATNERRDALVNVLSHRDHLAAQVTELQASVDRFRCLALEGWCEASELARVGGHAPLEKNAEKKIAAINDTIGPRGSPAPTVETSTGEADALHLAVMLDELAKDPLFILDADTRAAVDRLLKPLAGMRWRQESTESTSLDYDAAKPTMSCIPWGDDDSGATDCADRATWPRCEGCSTPIDTSTPGYAWNEDDGCYTCAACVAKLTAEIPIPPAPRGEAGDRFECTRGIPLGGVGPAFVVARVLSNGTRVLSHEGHGGDAHVPLGDFYNPFLWRALSAAPIPPAARAVEEPIHGKTVGADLTYCKLDAFDAMGRPALRWSNYDSDVTCPACLAKRTPTGSKS